MATPWTMSIELNGDEREAFRFVDDNGPVKLGAVAGRLFAGVEVNGAKQRAARVLALLVRGGLIVRKTNSNPWRHGGRHHTWEVK